MKQIILSLLVVCMAIGAPAQQYVIKGRITGFKEHTMFLLKDLDTQQDIDSALLVNGTFTMKGSLEDAPRTLWLYARTADSFYYCNLFIGNETVTVKGGAKDMPYFMNITGSKSQDVQHIVDRQTAALYYSRDSLAALAIPLMNKNEKPEEQARIWKLIRKIDDSVTVIRQRFITTHINSYAALKELHYIKRSFDTTTLRRLYNSVHAPYSQSRYGKAVNNYLLAGEPLKTGDRFTDFEAVDSSGITHRLSDIKGKYVLLDFTETYCGPCVMAVDELKTIADKHREKITVVSFNADPSRDIWLKGLRRDKPGWLNLWDGKGMYSATVLKYGVTGFPTFVLLSPEGKIIQRWSGYGKDELIKVIEKKLADGE